MKQLIIKFRLLSYIIIILIILMGLMFKLNFVVSANNDNMKNLDEMIQETITFMLEVHPKLNSQQRIIDQLENIALPRSSWVSSFDVAANVVTTKEEGIIPGIGLELSLPLFSAKRQKEDLVEKLRFDRELELDKQILAEMYAKLTSELTIKIDEIIQLRHRYDGRNNLYQLLRKRRIELSDLINTGISTPESLWDLDERITDLEIELADLKTQITLLINETARNFAADKWLEMKCLLEQITAYCQVVREDE